MPVETFPPGSGVATGWDVVGAADAGAALASEGDDSYVRSPVLGGTFVGLVSASFAGLTPPSGVVIRAVRLNYRARVEATIPEEGPTPRAQIRRRFLLDGTVIESSTFTRSAGAEPYWSPTVWVAAVPGRGAWTLADLAALSVDWTARDSSGADRVRLTAVRLEVDTNALPAATVTGPAGTVTVSAPPVTWTYSDAESDPQSGYEARVYVKPAGGWPAEGFPAASFLVAGSGVVASPAAGWSLPVNLDNGETYRAYVRVRQAWSGAVDAWSGWATGPEFTLDVVAPTAPTLTATADPSVGGTVLVVGPGAGGPIAATSLYVEYRDHTDDPWQTVRGAGEIPAAGGTVVDYEAPLGTTRTYRARARAAGVVSLGTTATATLSVGRATVWISDPRDPDAFGGRVIVDARKVRTWQGRDTVYRPVDLAVSIVESQPPTVEEEIELVAHDPASHDRAVEILSSTRTLLYRDDRRETFYFRWAGDRTRAQQGDRVFDHDRLSGTAVHVARPAVT